MNLRIFFFPSTKSVSWKRNINWGFVNSTIIYFFSPQWMVDVAFQRSKSFLHVRADNQSVLSHLLL